MASLMQSVGTLSSSRPQFSLPSPRPAPRISSHHQRALASQCQRLGTGQPALLKLSPPLPVIARASSAEQQQRQQQQQEADQVAWDENHEPGEAVEVPPGKVVDLMAVDFDKVLKAAGGKLLMVDVYTQWCGPCKMIAPEIEVMAEELGDSVILSKMDCTSDNDNKKWAMAQKVRALPTFIFFKNGERITEMTGAKTSSLRKLIEAHK
ncbi:thioredoxin-like protein [Dunaliella salina]|uniref:Thioredoxin-like protein n=1 Tax=Dunaliella salina TaxID=3046 RepID=A0ABQ7GDF2_DUNSA|nr:thioredoxin-like protein [Dunaliella salina]|eukprot:KAF5832643.1 thioredoxin-like protein [Dunaliella salina]